MSLTPQDIQAKQFHVRFRGFDVEEVDGFLEQVAENFLMLAEENKALQFKVETLTRELEQLRKDENSFKNAMISAQNIADGMLKKSREEADQLLSQTQEEVRRHKDEAIKEITELESKVDRLRGMQGDLQNDLRAVVNSYMAMIDDPGDTQVDDDSEVIDRPEEVESISSSLADSKAGEDDVSGLYEKIELPAEHPASQDFTEEDVDTDDELFDASVDEESEENGMSAKFDDDDIETPIPNLNDDIMFTLEDPLDSENTEDSKS